VARRRLVGRRFIEIAGPFGPGFQVVPVDIYRDGKAVREFLPLEVIERDFTLHWRDIEASRQFGMPLELGAVAVAAASCAQTEDELILKRLLAVEGRDHLALGDWEEPGSAFADVAAAREKLVSAGFYGPYALVVSPTLYTRMQRIFRGSGRLESRMIQEIAEGGIFQTPVLAENQGILVAQGVENVDLAVAQDLITAYLGPEGMDHRFRVLESIALRIRHPGAICVLERA